MTETEQILSRSYLRTLLYDAESGHYTAMIAEFPGCIADAMTRQEALDTLEEIAAEWIECELEDGHSIPEPESEQDYSGRLLLRMPKGLHGRLVQMADRESTSLNQLIVSALSTYDGAQRATDKVNERIDNLANDILAMLQASMPKPSEQFDFQDSGNLLPFRQATPASLHEERVRFIV